ncbi:hypothetical protein [Butyricimonas sp. RTP31003st1_G1_RTP31003_210430]|uniref:hypothetical protein n=1 Tax=Butyricimonas sp. RTP31003st1_G1_RTP31003_210430 TaxID=3143210 RepID=UPI0034A3B623
MRNLSKYFILSITLSLLCLGGCEKAMLDNNLSYASLYADSVYLSFDGNLNDPRVIDANLDEYMQAYRRLTKHLTYKEGFLSWDLDSASQVKVSQNIYDYLIGCWKYDNTLLASGEYKLDLVADGYRIMPKEIPLSSSRSDPPYPVPMLKGNNRFGENFGLCARIYREYYKFQSLAQYIDYHASEFSPDGYGIYSIQGIQNTLNASRVTGYATYYAANCCYTTPNYLCDANKIGSPYIKDSRDKDGIGEIIRAVRNLSHKHICANILVTTAK